MKKRILALALAAIMLMVPFTACSSSSSSTPAASASAAGTGSSSTASAEPDNSPITITVLNRVNAEIVLDDNPMLAAVAEKTGVTLEIEAPPISNYTDRLQLVMASGDLPDIIYTWEFDQNYEKWANDGLILPLDEYIEDYPNLMANISEGQWGKARVGGADGQIYAVPRPTGSASWGVISNDEWLEKLGVDMPTTPEEAYEYGKLVATQDPDGNGKNDTFLYSPYGLWADCWMIFPFLPFSLQHAASYLPDRDGEYKIKEKMDGYMPYLDFMRKMYAEGIIDPEFFTNKYYDDQTKFKQGRVALLHGGITNIPEFAAKDVPNAAEIYSFHPALKGENDEKPRNEAAAATWGGWMINADVDPEKLPRILSFLDWANSEEGFVTIAAGVQVIYQDMSVFPNLTVAENIALTINKSENKKLVNWKQVDEVAQQAFDKIGVQMPLHELLEDMSVADKPELNEFAMNSLTAFQAAVEQIDIPVVKCPEIDNWAAENPDIASQKEQMEVSYVVGEISKEDLEAFLNDVYFPSVADAEAAYIETMNAYKAANG